MCVLFGDFLLLLGTVCLKLGEGRGDQDLQQSLNDMQRSKLWIYHAPVGKGTEKAKTRIYRVHIQFTLVECLFC